MPVSSDLEPYRALPVLRKIRSRTEKAHSLVNASEAGVNKTKVLREEGENLENWNEKIHSVDLGEVDHRSEEASYSHFGVVWGSLREARAPSGRLGVVAREFP